MYRLESALVVESCGISKECCFLTHAGIPTGTNNNGMKKKFFTDHNGTFLDLGKQLLQRDRTQKVQVQIVSP